jgi:formate dehydrogenase iron-sulfur subunit
VVEIPFGATLRQIINNFGGGTFSGRPIRAIQVGGPLGAYLPEEQWDTPLDYEAFSAINAMLGHGGIVVFDDTVDMAEQARFAMEFCVEESCGKCTPCRIGSVRGVEVIDKIRKGDQTQDNLILLHDLCDTMEQGSLCAMGGLTPTPVKSVLNHFPEDMGVSTTANAEA